MRVISSTLALLSSGLTTAMTPRDPNLINIFIFFEEYLIFLNVLIKILMYYVDIELFLVHTEQLQMETLCLNLSFTFKELNYLHNYPRSKQPRNEKYTHINKSDQEIIVLIYGTRGRPVLRMEILELL